MSYELSTLEMLCIQEHNNENPLEKKVGEKEIADEIQRIKREWRITACMHFDTGVLQTYFRQHQLSLISLIEDLENHNGFDQVIYNDLEELMIFLIESFASFIDMNVTIPVYSLPKTRQMLAGKLVEFEKFVEDMEVPVDLSQAIFKIPHSFLHQNEKNHIHFYRVRFLLNFEKSLDDLSHLNIPKEKITDAIVNRLCFINYNSPGIYEAIKQYIKEKSAKKESIGEQVSYLKATTLHFKHLPFRTDIYYKPDNRILARAISDWLRRYISTKESEQNIISSEDLPDTEIENTTRVMTSLSIEELALMIRLSIEVGVIRIKNNGLSGLSRFMARNVRTLTKGIFDEFKPESFYKYYYSASLVNITSVKSILKRKLRKVEDMEKLIKSGKTIPTPSRK